MYRDVDINWRDGFPNWIGGRHVTVTVGDKTLSGVVELASRGRGAQPFIEFDNGTSIDWTNDDDAKVTAKVRSGFAD